MPTRIIEGTPPRLAPDLIARFAAIPVPIVVDLLEGRTLVDPAIRPLRRVAGGGALLGTAVTALCPPQDYGAVHHAIAAAGAGDVVVIDAGGRGDVAMIGDLLSTAARRKGVAGLVVDGAIRDTGTLAGWSDFQAFTRHVTPRGPASKDGGVVNGPVTIGGAPVRPGDLILGDDDGVVVIPREAAAGLIDQARARAEAEIGWERQIAAGESTLALFGVPAAVREPGA
ncbi:4-carboxy-4-hydroxy-2-oxoadipate aldolase [Methylobacterium crusticola]|uniref:Putative 4-hydroxy-4-methyl-2-oxoglutarate aldolase n=1 Tax=Methylobacterium crusticola TaxID=1697972 RepID=A0ABQ4QR04_9HYPH|nr:dimethylmenaquinone methyltransferase [Methylobacterium crusticola]GJD47730.1 4-carboxy-4-hydroxy-2-oxoadipate aldolase [Methylobacterium crusticola]